MQIDLDVLLQQLREEVSLLNNSIVVIERLASGRPKRRGRPPKWLSAARLQSIAAEDPEKKE